MSGTSWVSVKDAQGKTLFSGSLSGTRSFTGQPPYRVIIGKASAVASLQYQGNAVDLDNVSGNNVARLTIQ